MQRLIISQSEADLTSHAGLGLIGRALNECTNLAADAKAISPLRSGAIGHANILSSSVALLCLGKSDFEAINEFREDPYFATCQDPCDYIPRRSYPRLQAREVLRLLAEEGIEGSGKEAEPRGDGV